MIYLILPPAMLFSLLLSLFLYVNSVSRPRKRGGEREFKKKRETGRGREWEGEREPLGTERNYSSLNCFHHSKYSNNFFFLKRAEIILKKVNATALCGTSWGLLSHLLARKLSAHTLMRHLTSLKGLYCQASHLHSAGPSHRPALWSYVAHKP